MMIIYDAEFAFIEQCYIIGRKRDSSWA